MSDPRLADERAVLKSGDVVTFDAVDSKARTPGSSLGTAEFCFCQKWVRGKLRAVYVTALQQREPGGPWRIDCEHGAGDFTVQSWTHKGVKEPRAWIYFWCKEHRCVGMRVYVPRNSNQFSVRTGSGVGIYFDQGPL